VRTIAFLTVAAVLIGCGGPVGGGDAGSPDPRIATSPARVDFGLDGGTAVTVGSVGTVDLTIYNSGGGTLVLSSVTLQADPEFTANRPMLMSLDAGATTTVTVSFSPMVVKNYTGGRLVISSNAKNAPTAGITVQGVGKAP
jgi:hypothetical protein